MSKFGLPTIIESDNPLPERILGYVSVEGKESVFAPDNPGFARPPRHITRTRKTSLQCERTSRNPASRYSQKARWESL